METFEGILEKDIDDVVDWAYKIPLVNVPKAVELALQTVKDKSRRTIVRMRALAIILALPPHERGSYGPWPLIDVAKVVASLYQIAEDEEEGLDIRLHVREHIPRILQRLPDFDKAFQKLQMERHLHFCKDCGKAWRLDAKACDKNECKGEHVRMCPWCVPEGAERR